MTRFKYLFILLILYSCRAKNEHKIVGIQNKNNFINDSTFVFIKLAGPFNNIKDSVFNNFKNYFGSFNDTTFPQEFVESVVVTPNFKFKASSDSFQLYNLTLKKIPSNVWPYQYSIIINNSRKEICVLPIYNGEVVRLGKEEKIFNVTGINKYSGFGYYSVFDLIRDTIKQVFQAKKEILNESNSCVIFQPFCLVDSLIDLNKDGYCDIVFKGNYLNFCEGYEDGPNYYEGDPIKSFGPIKYVYIQKPSNNGSLIFTIDSALSILPPDKK